MQGDELKAIRRQLGLTVRELGVAFGYTGNANSVGLTIRRYERGEKPIPPWIARLAIMYARFGIPVDFETRC